ncbi:hypothetical protein [Nonomuraea sp. NPDC005501]|uniref:hypothetical protein n=1 Tax=Nonomuraea sp. NPDC005501 TaxID=3156884 RepID=UPI0033AFAC8D
MLDAPLRLDGYEVPAGPGSPLVHHDPAVRDEPEEFRRLRDVTLAPARHARVTARARARAHTS